MPYSSPFEPELRKRGAVYGTVGDVNVPLHFGDPARELEALRKEAAVVDLPWRALVEVTGRDRVRFLHGMCTNDIKALQPGQGCMAAIVNRQGKMVAEMVVRAGNDRLYLEMDRSNVQAAVEALTKFLVADDVRFSPASRAALGIFGPRPATGWGDSFRGLRPFDFVPAFGEGPLVSRDPTLGVDGCIVWKSPEWTSPAETSALAGLEAYETLRIENGFPLWGADMGPDLLPMEAGLESLAISYTKGCYIGQEVIQRVKTYSEPPRMLVQLAFEGKPAPGTRVLAGGEEVGKATSVGNGLALAILRKEHKAPGTMVEIEPGIAATVRALPWQAAR